MKLAVNFLYIGPDKSGSTWLYEILKAHPQVFVPEAKDIYFFDKFYHKGLDWYASFFKEADGYKAIGEISHDYLFSKEAAIRIWDTFGSKIKLLTFLRDPAEKAWSAYLFAIRSALIPEETPFWDAVKKLPYLVEKSLYGKYLKNYYEIFRPDQIKIFKFDDLKADPVSFAKQVFDVLGVDFVENLPYTEKKLPASKARFYYLAKAAKWSANLLRNLGLVNLLGKIKTNDLVLKLLYKPYNKKPELPKEIRQELIEKYYLKDLELLSEITGRDFLEWARV